MIVEDGSSADPAARLPGSIRAAIAHPAGGTIAMTGFPGLETAIDGTAVFDPESCRETVVGLRDLGADTLVVLIESDELAPEFLSGLDGVAGEVGLSISHFPIADYAAPTPDSTRIWAEAAPARAKIFAEGGTLAFACQFGAGRSGTMAAHCLIEGGLSPEAAIARVRSHFPVAIESDAQEQWLLSHA